MHTYIAMLRGVNVGKKRMKMEQLKAMFGALGFRDAKTYVQSGNVVFGAAGQSPEALSEAIGLAIENEFGFDAPVIIRTADELEAVIRRNPFEAAESRAGQKVSVTFLAKEPAPDAVEALEKFRNGTDDFRVVGREAYIWTAHYGETDFSNTFFEKKLKLTGTTRNWQTVNKLAEMGRG